MTLPVNDAQQVRTDYGVRLVRSKKSYNIPEEYKDTLQTLAMEEKKKDEEKK